MAYTNGTFQYFDNSFMYNIKDFNKPIDKKYDPNTLLGYIQINHPKWFMILEKADRLHFFQKSYHNIWTMFIPNEDSLSFEFILNCDKNASLNLFNYHTLKGYYDKNILETSRFQNLNNLINGQSIYCISLPNEILLNHKVMIQKYDILYENVIMHIISSLL